MTMDLDEVLGCLNAGIAVTSTCPYWNLKRRQKLIMFVAGNQDEVRAAAVRMRSCV